MPARLRFVQGPSRKYRFPTGGVIVTVFDPAALVSTLPVKFSQLVLARLPLVCRTKPVEGYGHEMIALLFECAMDSVGGAGVLHQGNEAQKPPVTE